MPAKQAVKHVVAVGEHVPHVVKNRKAQVVLHERKRWRWKPQLQVVQEQRRAACWKSRGRISRARLVQPESTMRVASAHIKALRQRNQRVVSRTFLPRLSNDGIRKWLLQSDSRGARKYELPAIYPAKRVVARVLQQDPAKVRLRSKITRRYAGIDRIVGAPGGLQIVIAVVSNIAESRLTHAHRQ